MSALILAADGSEEIELVTVTDILARVSVPTKIVVPNPSLKIICAYGTRLLADICLTLDNGSGRDDDISHLFSFDILVIPGGLKGIQLLSELPAALSLVAHYASRSLAAICAGPLLLAKASALKGCSLTCYPGLEQKLTAEGYHVKREAEIVRDRTLLTAQGPAMAMAFGLAIVEMIKGPVERESVAQALLYRD